MLTCRFVGTVIIMIDFVILVKNFQNQLQLTKQPKPEKGNLGNDTLKPFASKPDLQVNSK